MLSVISISTRVYKDFDIYLPKSLKWNTVQYRASALFQLGDEFGLFFLDATGFGGDQERCTSFYSTFAIYNLPLLMPCVLERIPLAILDFAPQR